jgi:hypothetical protein
LAVLITVIIRDSIITSNWNCSFKMSWGLRDYRDTAQMTFSMLLIDVTRKNYLLSPPTNPLANGEVALATTPWPQSS